MFHVKHFGIFEKSKNTFQYWESRKYCFFPKKRKDVFCDVTKRSKNTEKGRRFPFPFQTQPQIQVKQTIWYALGSQKLQNVYKKQKDIEK